MYVYIYMYMYLASEREGFQNFPQSATWYQSWRRQRSALTGGELDTRGGAPGEEKGSGPKLRGSKGPGGGDAQPHK